jgi:hypothetical protein
MFGSTVLEVAFGLSFCFAALALTVSTVQEALASALRLRAHTLLDGVKSMLNDPTFTALARALYAHPLVNPHGDGAAANEHTLKARPSYIEPKHFALALLETIQSVPGNYAQLGRDIEAQPDPQVRRVLLGMYQRAGGDMQVFQAAIEGWFNNAMERVSGSYKRRSLLVSLLLSLLFAVLFNIDSIHLFRTLWQHPALVAQLGMPATTLDPQTLQALLNLPIGWNSFPPVLDQSLLLSVAGWMLTASTALFGAPFWFDLLQHIMQIRGTGAKELLPKAEDKPVAPKPASIAPSRF